MLATATRRTCVADQDPLTSHLECWVGMSFEERFGPSRGAGSEVWWEKDLDDRGVCEAGRDNCPTTWLHSGATMLGANLIRISQRAQFLSAQNQFLLAPGLQPFTSSSSFALPFNFLTFIVSCKYTVSSALPTSYDDTTTSSN